MSATPAEWIKVKRPACALIRTSRPLTIENRIIPQKPSKTVEEWKKMWYHTFWIIVYCVKVREQKWKTIQNVGVP